MADPNRQPASSIRNHRDTASTNNSYRTSLYGDIDTNSISNYGPMSADLNAAGDWELSVNEVDIGFWPRSNYRDSFPFATMVRWGGEIINHEKSGRHTSTQMGSGHFSSEGIGKAAYVIDMILFDPQGRLYNAPNELKTFATNPMCYDVTLWKDDNLGSYITVGGPGFKKAPSPNNEFQARHGTFVINHVGAYNQEHAKEPPQCQISSLSFFLLSFGSSLTVLFLAIALPRAHVASISASVSSGDRVFLLQSTNLLGLLVSQNNQQGTYQVKRGGSWSPVSLLASSLDAHSLASNEWNQTSPTLRGSAGKGEASTSTFAKT
ncbi:hypothetical protein EJ110_NYTH01803 [Nymphaea thermarum]|nr:hypothetical protein EJ110_NYTH01803 [Nymphaea thermarum]